MSRVDAIRTIRVDAAGIDLGKIGIGAAFGGCHANLGRGGLVVELDPQALQQFLGLSLRESSIVKTFFVERLEVPVQVTGAERVPSVQLNGHPQVNEPVILQGFPKVTRGMRRDISADISDMLQLRLAGRVSFPGRQKTGFFGMPLGEADEGGGANRHGAQFLFPVIGMRVVQKIQTLQAVSNILLKIQHAFMVDLVVQDGMTGSTLLHELGKDAGLVGGFPLRCHFRKEQIPHRMTLPRRE